MRKISAPNPIAGGFVFPYRGVEEFTGHIFGPGPVGQVLPHTQVPLEGNVEPSVVGDFHGSIAMGFLIGEVDSSDGPQNLEVDLRVMQGDYIGEDGKQQYGTFALF